MLQLITRLCMNRSSGCPEAEERMFGVAQEVGGRSEGRPLAEIGGRLTMPFT
jgi:hypothetical protein